MDAANISVFFAYVGMKVKVDPPGHFWEDQALTRIKPIPPSK